MHEAEHESIVRGCLNFPFAFILYLATFFGTQMVMGIGGITIYSVMLGLPILFIAAFTVAGILTVRDRLPPVPASTSMPIALLTSMVLTVAMFLPILIGVDPSKAALLAALIAASSLLAGLTTFGYAEVLRDQFPRFSSRRSDAP